MLTKKTVLPTGWYEYTAYTDNMKQTKITYLDEEIDAPQVWSFAQIEIIDSKQFILFGKFI
jgi:uracil-DNA glycosylase